MGLSSDQRSTSLELLPQPPAQTYHEFSLYP